MAVIKRSGVVWYVQNGRMAKGRLEWQDRGMAEQRNGMAGSGNGKWRNGRMAEWQKGGMRNGGMAEWW